MLAFGSLSKSWDVFDEEGTWATSFHDIDKVAHKGHPVAAPLSRATGGGEVLARRAADNEVGWMRTDYAGEMRFCGGVGNVGSE